MSEPQGEEGLPQEDTYPFYELRFIMRVLDHEGKAPIEDWRTARGMARAIFERWHQVLSKRREK